MIKSDKWIRKQCKKNDMIKPFDRINIREFNNKKIVSRGLSSYGYDISLGEKLFLFHNKIDNEIDPKEFLAENCEEINSFEDEKGRFFKLPPHSFALGESIEYCKIPRNILVVCIGKSTYARCGLDVPITPLEPEWEGNITLEFANKTNKFLRIYVGEGIAQLLFFEGENCETSYADRNNGTGGKYQKQTGITLPR